MDSIQASTSRSYQHSLRLPGILNGRGIRWLYLELVAKVRNQTIAVDEMIIKSSEIWNDDRATAPELTPQR